MRQVQEVLGAMNQDSGVEAVSLKVDGGMTANGLLMQFQADLLGMQVNITAFKQFNTFSGMNGSKHTVTGFG